MTGHPICLAPHSKLPALVIKTPSLASSDLA